MNASAAQHGRGVCISAAEFLADWNRMRYGDLREVYECPGCGGYHLTTPHDQRNATNRDRRNERRKWRREHGR